MLNGIERFCVCIAAAGLSSWAVAQNRAPIADAGADRFMYTGSAIMLFGGGSDPDGDTLTDVLWTVESTPPAADYNLETPSYPFSTFSGYTPGHYGLTFKVFDGQLWSAADAMAIQVVSNQAPLARAGISPTSGTAPLTVTYDGSSSVDPEGRPLTHYWSFGDGGDSSYAAAGTHVFTMPGTFQITLEVTDELGATGVEFVLVQAARFNLAPLLSPLAFPLNGPAPLTVQFSSNALDPDGDPLTYLWDFGDAASPDNRSALHDPSHVYTTAGTYLATLTVDDGRTSTQATLSITAVPEPGTWAMLVAGLALLGGRAGRRRGRCQG